MFLSTSNKRQRVNVFTVPVLFDNKTTAWASVATYKITNNCAKKNYEIVYAEHTQYAPWDTYFAFYVTRTVWTYA